MSITTILFDADGVVQHSRFRDQPLFVELGGDDFWRDVWELELSLFAGGEFRPAAETLLRKRGSNVPLERVLELWTSIEVDPEVLDLIAGLRGTGYRCVLTTNQQEYRGAHMRGALGYEDVFDTQFYSCELGLAKPDPGYFCAVLDALNCAPAAALFVDDTAENVVAARTVGLAAEQHDPASGVVGLRQVLLRHHVAVPAHQ